MYRKIFEYNCIKYETRRLLIPESTVHFLINRQNLFAIYTHTKAN